VGVFWGRYMQSEPGNFAKDIAALFGWMAEGRINPHICARYRLAEGARALEDLMNRRVTGKVVIQP
jgi:NADPH2:quinone reductase